MIIGAQDRQSYTIPHVYGTLGGATITTDASDPNAADPGTRAVRLSQAICQLTGPTSIIAYVADGTSLTLQPWIYNDPTAHWFKYGATIVAPVQGISLSIGGAMYGVKIFFQITNVSGAVTQYYWILR